MSAPCTVLVSEQHPAMPAAWAAGLAKLHLRAPTRLWEIPAWCVAVTDAQPELALAVEAAAALAGSEGAGALRRAGATIEAVLPLLAPLMHGEVQPWTG